MEQSQVPDLNEVARWLATFYEELRAIRAVTAAPVNYSIDADKLKPWIKHREERREDMNHQLAWLRNLMLEEFNASGFIPEILEGEDALHPENAVARFKESEEPLEARLTKMEDAFKGSFDIVTGLIEEVMSRFEHDQQLIKQAAESARFGNYAHATDVMGGASRLFKNVAYWQPDRQASQMASTLTTIEKDFKGRQRKVEELTTELEGNQKLRTGNALNEARQLISEASSELFKARKAFPDATPDSPFSQNLAALEKRLIAWQGEQAARLDLADKSSKTFQKKLMVTGSVAGVVLVVALLVFLWARTGYRIASPNGEVRTASFCLPGEYRETFQLDGYQPYSATVPVSFGFFNDMGQVSRQQLQPLTGSAKLNAQPAGATFTLEGKGQNLGTTKSGDLPADLSDLPIGDYELTLALGAHRETRSVTVSQDHPLDETFTLQAGGVQLTTDPPGAKATLEGNVIGKTPVSVMGLPPGKHTFTLEVEANRVDVPFTVTAGEVTPLRHRFGFGGLVLKSDPPGATLTFLDAATIPSGKAPLEQPRIIARDYRIRAEHPGLDAKEFTTAVKPGETTEQTLTMDYASLIVSATPSLGTNIAVERPEGGDPLVGPAPLKVPLLKPGAYTIVATTSSKQRMPREFTATTGMRDQPVDFTFAHGKLSLESAPEGLSVSIPALKLFNQKTPVTIDRAVTGDYTATFNNGTATIRKKFTVAKDQATLVQANFLNTSLQERTDIPVYTKQSFAGDRRIEPGVGLKHARVGGELEQALKAYGKPDSVRRLPDPKLGSRFILSYSQMGLSLSTDGNTIQAINFTQIASRDPNRQPPPYWARTDKNITIGDNDAKLLRAYGPPPGSSGSRGISYPGITFFLQGSGNGGRTVSSIRISEEDVNSVAETPASGAPAAPAISK